MESCSRSTSPFSLKLNKSFCEEEDNQRRWDFSPITQEFSISVNGNEDVGRFDESTSPPPLIPLDDEDFNSSGVEVSFPLPPLFHGEVAEFAHDFFEKNKKLSLEAIETDKEPEAEVEFNSKRRKKDDVWNRKESFALEDLPPPQFDAIEVLSPLSQSGPAEESLFPPKIRRLFAIEVEAGRTWGKKKFCLKELYKRKNLTPANIKMIQEAALGASEEKYKDPFIVIDTWEKIIEANKGWMPCYKKVYEEFDKIKPFNETDKKISLHKKTDQEEATIVAVGNILSNIFKDDKKIVSIGNYALLALYHQVWKFNSSFNNDRMRGKNIVININQFLTDKRVKKTGL
jgi:hypothetical protein